MGYSGSLRCQLKYTQHQEMLSRNDSNLFFSFQERIEYTAIGDGSALAFFKINSNTGAVQVRNDLRQDSLTQYRVRFKIVVEGKSTFHFVIQCE